MPKYRLKEAVEANQWQQGAQIPGVVKVYKDVGEATKYATVVTPTGMAIANPGDWVVQDGRFWKVLKDEEFKKLYELVPAETKK